MAHSDVELPQASGLHLIGGEWTGMDGRSFGSACPVDGTIVWSGSEASEQEVVRAIEAARAAFESWSRLSLDVRMEVIERFSQIAAERKDMLAQIISKETGKALWDARTEAGAVAAKAGVSIKAYHERTGLKETDLGAMTLLVAHRPHGVMAVLGPFNFPAHLPNGHIVPALIAGNTVVFKPSEQAPATAEFMMHMWVEAGLPAGVINMVQGARTPAEHLVEHDGVDGVLFTGGVGAGLAIHRALAGKPHKMLALELGGNNPLVAWDAADAKAVARIAVKSAFLSAGQRCTCARRLIIPDGTAGEKYLIAIRSLIDELVVDLPDADEQPFYGALISDRAADEVLRVQTAMLASGGVAIRKAERTSHGKAFLRPGLIDVTDIPDRADEEVFGPLLQVIRVGDFNAAIREANNTRFGLSAGLISDKEALFETFARDVRAGVLNWNRQTTGASGMAPFGGPGLSGNLRPAGYYAADYCAWPMASLTAEGQAADAELLPGMPE